MSARALRVGLPIVVFALVVLCWDLLVRAFAIPPYVLPSSGLVLATLIADAGLLWRSLLVTLTLTFEGFLLAAVVASCWQSHSTNGDWSNIRSIHMPSFFRSPRLSPSRRFC